MISSQAEIGPSVIVCLMSGQVVLEDRLPLSGFARLVPETFKIYSRCKASWTSRLITHDGEVLALTDNLTTMQGKVMLTLVHGFPSPLQSFYADDWAYALQRLVEVRAYQVSGGQPFLLITFDDGNSNGCCLKCIRLYE